MTSSVLKTLEKSHGESRHMEGKNSIIDKVDLLLYYLGLDNDGSDGEYLPKSETS